MDFTDPVSTARDSITVKRVYGDAYERNGVTVIPAAAVFGGAGGGTGDQPDGSSGGGGGFGLGARPVGAYVVRGDQVTWQPAIDVSRVILGGQLLALAGFLVIRSIARRNR
jgi:uncharacterized spore protein YtfJ